MKTVVVGGGPSGMIAAYYQAKNGADVTLIEKNEKLGKKLYITGKGRCNVTNNCSPEEFLANVVTNGRFLTGAINRFSPSDFMAFLSEKTPLKTERGNRVYPISDKASDITKCFEKHMSDVGVKVCLNEAVRSITVADGNVAAVVTDKRVLPCDKVIVCTGGKSYLLTGSTGDGYKFAKNVGHTLVDVKPALCGINLDGDKHKPLQGVSLKNVAIKVYVSGKVIYEDFGEMLFTHFGVSGPIVLSASSYLNKYDLTDSVLSLDLKPALSEEQLDARLLRDFDKYKNKQIKNSLSDLLISSLIPLVIKEAGICGEIKNNELKAADRKKLVYAVKNVKFKPKSLRPADEAIVCSGGVSVKEINPKTMESKIVKGLYFAGEVLDVDALTGGFNITVAACTGYVAGNS